MQYRVTLYNRQTNQPHRIDDHVVTIVTQRPEFVSDQLLRNRHLEHWEVKIEPFES